jgi:zinc protease
MGRMRIVASIAALALVLAVGAPAAGAAAALPTWPQARSDLKPDPAAVFGVLPNGLRYAVQKNATPPGVVYMRLAIQAGSMQEAHDQEGLAHLLEHMAFRGSTHVASGEAMKILQREGARPGADTNAGTGSTSTTYMFNLAHNDPASVDTGFMLLREIASELTLDPKEMEAERPIVLAEERQGAGPNRALSEAIQHAEFGDHPFARPVIGRREVIQSAPPGRVRDFYEAYYRPERAVLVVAGDIDPAAMEAKIKARFSDWKGRGAPGSDPAALNGDPGGAAVQLIAVEGAGHTGLTLLWPMPYEAPDAGKAHAMQQMIDGLGGFAFQQRLLEMAKEAKQPFSSAGARRYSIRNVATGGIYTADTVADPDAALTLMIKAQRQLVEFGFTQAEVDQAVAGRRAALQRAVDGAATRPTAQLVAELLNSALADEVDLSPAQRLALFDEATRNLKAERVTARLRGVIGGAPAHLVYFGPAPLEGGVARLTKTQAEAARAPVAAYAFAAARPWPHTDFGRPGRVVERRSLDDLGVTFVRFANGVRLTVKPTEFEKDRVAVKVRFGHGRLDEPKDRLSAADWSTSLLSRGGLADMTEKEVQTSLVGKGVMAFATQEEDAFAITNVLPGPPLQTPSKALELQMQLTAAFITQPGWRADIWPVLVNLERDGFVSADKSPGSVFGRNAPLLLHSGDHRWAFATPADEASWTPDQARAFLQPILEQAPLEVIVVGDITVDQAVAAAARTFGALPPRPDRPEPPGLREVAFPGPTPRPVLLRHKGRADQAMVDVSWPATDLFADTKAYAAAGVLADILRDRANDQLRIAEGKTYGPNAQAAFSSSLPGYGRLAISVNLNPQDVDAVYRSIDAIAADLAARPPSADEFARALGSRVEAVKRSQRLNAVWSAELGGAQTDPRRVAYLRNQLAELEAVTPADVQAAAAKWLVRDRSWRMTVLPEAQPAAVEAPD